MAIELKMPALSPTMEEGTLAKWLVKEGDTVASGDILAEIETDKATMEFEAVDEGTVTKILVSEGTDGVKVGTPIALIGGEGEEAAAPAAAAPAAPAPAPKADAVPAKAEAPAPAPAAPAPAPVETPPAPAQPAAAPKAEGERIKASPLARKLAEAQGIDLSTLTGSGPGGRIVRADLGQAAGGAVAQPQAAAAPSSPAPAAAAAPAQPFTTDIPHEAVKLSNMRKTIARRLTEAKREIPHIYLTVDVRLDALLKLRSDLNAGLSGRGVKLSVNDLLIKALAVGLEAVPECNVSFTPDQLIKYSRSDIAVAVSIPGGLITPIIVDAGSKSVSRISTEMHELASRAKEGKLQPYEYQGGTASISNMGMFGIKQFDAVINPPQAMILAVGAGEKRPWVDGDAVTVATVMSITGSFDHRAIDGADGARLMKTLKELIESPLGLVA
ncbi:pyruvate dehydrogenase complex dihydrolipoamide acetyltransferase [Sphingomonas astaxanthinifaciens]|uniref:pyruvate dehydrogenase complex dihydrolipoamide acetyltransferase n=2 Tax=Sphingomonas astaxanthinifaciens TaxID=407019 RepID=UPI0004A74CCA|nr:pyruvate dehydrogenase complex dihydrolipoamide acetyltransferase [Sphingomonas astaxanthinifaciens]